MNILSPRTLFFLLVFVLFLTSQVASQTFDEELEQLNLKDLFDIKIEMSSLKAKTIFNTPSTVSVITQDMIQSYNFKTLSEAIQILAGIAVYPTYHKRDLPSGRGILQNQYSNKILFLVNGIPTWHAITGEANFERIDIKAVERIEVLKGPASVLYGSNAYSGAVNVVLKSTYDTIADFFIGFGDGYALTAGGNYGFSRSTVKTYAGGGIYNEKGNNFKWTDKDGVTGYFQPYYKTGNISLSFNWYNDHTIFFNGTSSSQAFFGSNPLFSSGAGHPHATDGYLINYTFSKQFIDDKLEMNSGLTYDWNQVNFPFIPFLADTFEGIPVAVGESLNMNWAGYRLNVFSNFRTQFNDIFSLELGLDSDYRKSLDSSNTKIYFILKDQFFSTIGFEDKSVYELSAISQIGIDYKKLALLLGTRITMNEFYGINISPRMTCNLSFNETNCLKFIYGQSFRSPSFLEVHIMPVDSSRRGNKDLNPERSNSYEIAYLTSFANFFVQTLGYYATYEDKIVRVNKVDSNATPPQNYQTFGNGKTFNAWGIELELKYENPRIFNFFVNGSYIIGNEGDIDETDHYNFKYIPSITSTIGMAKSFRGFHLSAVLNAWTKTKSHSEVIGLQHYLDINMGYTHSFSLFRFRHFLSLKNVYNRRVVFPEYADRDSQAKIPLNEIPTEFGYGRRVGYTVSCSF